jgi:adenine/guanine phosphoribosyltransferase-like PRPP-binding protein
MANDTQQTRTTEGHQPGADNQDGTATRRAFIVATVTPRAYVELCRPTASDAVATVEAMGYVPASITQMRDADHVCMQARGYLCTPIDHMRGTRGYQELQTKLSRALAAGYWPVHL